MQLTRHGGSAPFESPDGRFLYYMGATPSDVWRVPAEGGTETAVIRGAAGRWDLGADGIYFIAEDHDASSASTWVLKRFRFDTRKLSVVSRLEKPPWGPSPLDVSPDGSWFIYVQNDRDDSDLMLVENFR